MMDLKWQVIIVCCVCMSQGATIANGQLIINTRVGLIMGVTVQHGSDNLAYTQFLGIPYAEPPTGALRFQRPLPKRHLIQPSASDQQSQNVFNATSFGPVCPQPSMLLNLPGPTGHAQNEDCLSLNIYVPGGASVENPVPVMVFLHGGGFFTGAGMMFNASEMVTSGDVIIVTINYRLGILGFLSTADNNAKGNYGLWDAALALKWVHSTIDAFGGDVNRITLFGESSGGDSAGLQAVSPISRGLFQRVIYQSASPTSSITLQVDPVRNANTIADHLSCPTYTNNQIVECLRNATVEEVISAQSFKFPMPTFAHVVDGEFLPTLPIHLASETRMYDMLFGLNKEDGRLILYDIANNTFVKPPEPLPDLSSGMRKDHFSSLVDMFTLPFDSSGRLGVLYKSFVGPTDSVVRVEAAVDLLTDMFFLLPAIQLARIHAGEQTNTYLYRFDPFNAFPWHPWTYWADAATHYDEIMYLAGYEESARVHNFSVSQEDITLSRQMIKYWTNFAKSGNPNTPGIEGLATRWPQFEQGSEEFIILDRNMGINSIGSKMFDERVNFWMEHLQIFGPIAPPTTAATAGACCLRAFCGILFLILMAMPLLM